MKHRAKNRRRREGLAPRAICGAVALALLAMQVAPPALAGQEEQARRIYERLAGVPPSATVLNMMVTAIQAQPGNAGLVAAAAIATDPKYAPDFYDATLKEFINPWTNRNQSAFVPFNDYTATVIGMIRDDVPFNTVLSANILYTVNAPPGVSLPPPSPANNDHYATAEADGVDFANYLVQTTQTAAYGTPPQAVAGVWTTRAGAAAYFVLGTNRAQFRFTMLNYLCHDMQTVMDNTRPSDRVRQDVARSPGGDSRVFLNNCAGCHTGMDPMAQAFAYYDFSTTTNQLVYTQGQVQPKYVKNPQNFPWGFVTPDDTWSNRWRTGPNADLGWDPNLPGSGEGAASLGQELENTTAFANCQVVKVFQQVCLHTPLSLADQGTVATIQASFQNGYDLKQVFQQTAASCAGN
ncbi:MAG TPA: hypothetical protein VMF03_00835 [Steroidobacteraceae bacterium]|nr:hypothetical protein [Steroidobacteraceae bacterium]